MGNEFDKEGFKKAVAGDIARGRKQFDVDYHDALARLSGLSDAELKAIVPSVTDRKQYDALVEVVREASRVNLAQGELVARVKALGNVAVAIARKVPSFGALL